MATAFTKVQIRRGSESEWKKYNTVLGPGEIGFEEDTYRFKIGQYNRETGRLYDWNTLPYFGSESLIINDILVDGEVEISDKSCISGNLIPCADDTYTIGDAAKRWKNVHASEAIQLGDLVITQGPASAATGEENNFLKVNGDDIATRTELEKVTTTNLRLEYPTGDDGVIPIPQYVYSLFTLLERSLPPMADISTQSQFNSWVVEALEHVDEVAHQGDKDENGNIIIGGDSSNIIIGPKPGVDEEPTCNETLDIYAHTTVHCTLEAKKGIKVLDSDETHFVKANGTVSTRLPLEQSYWIDVPRL